jgi:hypothetical protein
MVNPLVSVIKVYGTEKLRLIDGDFHDWICGPWNPECFLESRKQWPGCGRRFISQGMLNTACPIFICGDPGPRTDYAYSNSVWPNAIEGTEEGKAIPWIFQGLVVAE